MYCQVQGIASPRSSLLLLLLLLVERARLDEHVSKAPNIMADQIHVMLHALIQRGMYRKVPFCLPCAI